MLAGPAHDLKSLCHQLRCRRAAPNSSLCRPASPCVFWGSSHSRSARSRSSCSLKVLSATAVSSRRRDE